MIRKAQAKDAPRVHALLEEIVKLHHEGRPDIFAGTSPKYDVPALVEKFQKDGEYIFVPDNENNSRINRCVTTGYTEKAGHFTTVLRQMKRVMI